MYGNVVLTLHTTTALRPDKLCSSLETAVYLYNFVGINHASTDVIFVGAYTVKIDGSGYKGVLRTGKERNTSRSYIMMFVCVKLFLNGVNTNYNTFKYII